MRNLRSVFDLRARPPALYPLALLALLGGALLWATRNAPITLGPLRIDALAALFALFSCGAPLLAALVGSGPTWRGLMIVLALIAASLGPTPQINAWFLFLAALSGAGRGQVQRSVASLVLLAAGGMLATRGVGDFAARVPPGALDANVFGVTLLGVLIGIFAPSEQGGSWRAARCIWLLPLLRLFSYGSWDLAWVTLAASTGALAAAACGMHAWRTGTLQAAWRILPCCGLAAAGAASSLGIAAVVAVLAADGLGAALGRRAANHWVLLGAPALAIWFTAGALLAGGAPALLAPLLIGAALAGVVMRVQATDSPAPVWLVGLSLGWLVLAPLLLRIAAQPTVEQLQAGLSVYGELALVRRVGLVALDSARREVLALPVLLIAALIGVLWAAIVLVRVVNAGAAQQAVRLHTPVTTNATTPAPLFMRELRARLPWLGGRDDRR